MLCEVLHELRRRVKHDSHVGIISNDDDMDRYGLFIENQQVYTAVLGGSEQKMRLTELMTVQLRSRAKLNAFGMVWLSKQLEEVCSYI